MPTNKKKKGSKKKSKNSVEPKAVAIDEGSANEIRGYIFAKYRDRWNAMDQEIEKAGMDLKKDEAEKLCGAQFDDIARIYREEWKKLTRQDLTCTGLDLLVVYPHAYAEHVYRAGARHFSGNHQGCIDDCNAVEAWHREMVAKPPHLRGGFDPFPFLVNLLYLRGSAFRRTGNIRGAIADLREGYILKRKTAPEQSAWLILEELLKAFAMDKKDCPRPHYTHEERMAIEQELGINMFCEQEMRCAECKKEPSDKVNLQYCTRCRQVWYCGRTCQEKDWSSHKKTCNAPHGLRDMERGALEGVDIETLRNAESSATSLEPNEFTAQPMLRDPTSGRFFGSFSNKDVYFIPSEIPLMPKKYRPMAQECELQRRLRLVDQAYKSDRPVRSTNANGRDSCK